MLNVQHSGRASYADASIHAIHVRPLSDPAVDAAAACYLCPRADSANYWPWLSLLFLLLLRREILEFVGTELLTAQWHRDRANHSHDTGMLLLLLLLSLQRDT